MWGIEGQQPQWVSGIEGQKRPLGVSEPHPCIVDPDASDSRTNRAE